MSRSSSLFALASLTLASLVSCGPPAPEAEVDGWALARAALVDGESCYARMAAYCIREPSFIDAAIQQALDGRFDGTMPKGERKVEDVIRSARGRYKSASQEPAQLEQITALVKAHYDAPAVDASDDEVINVDIGALPGTLAVRGRTPTLVLADSPMIEEFWWSGAEAGRVLAKHAAAHADKAIVRVELRIPKGSGSDKHLAYRYFRAQNRVAFGEVGDTSVYLSPEIDGGLEAMAAGKLDLSRDARTMCSKPKTGGSTDWCPWRDPYAEAKRAAEREAKRAARRK